MPWQPRRTARINPARINVGDIIEQKLGTGWILVHSVDRRPDYVEMLGYQVLDVKANGDVTTGRFGRLSAGYDELRVIGWP